MREACHWVTGKVLRNRLRRESEELLGPCFPPPRAAARGIDDAEIRLQCAGTAVFFCRRTVRENVKLWMPAVLVGFLIDCLIGDPAALPHPIVLIGKGIAALEKLLRARFPKTPEGERAAGRVLVVCMLLLSAAVPAAILWICFRISRWLYFAVCCIMSWQIFAAKCLKQEALKVRRCLDDGDLPAARRQVGMLVGRDTAELTAEQVTKAAVETVAENTSDGVIAPLLYLMIGGPVLGFVYKAINTMDSMLGYKNEKYLNFGRCAAKTDDVANFIPARLSAVGMIAAAGLTGFDAKNAARIWRRDRRKHASPNSAQTESVCAGALHIRLAGNAYYFGKLYEKPYIGDPDRAVEPADISRTCKLMYGTSILLLVILEGVGLLITLLL